LSCVILVFMSKALSTGWQGLNLVRLGGGGYQEVYDDTLCDGDPDCPFVRFGGVQQFRKLAVGVHHKMQAHSMLKHYFPPTIDIEPIILKDVAFMCGFFGGPQYKGPGLRESHAFLHITNDEYDVLIDIFRQTISEMRVRDLEAVEDVLEAVEGWRSVIVDASRPKPRRSSKDRQRKRSKETSAPTVAPTVLPTVAPIAEPTFEPTLAPTAAPTASCQASQRKCSPGSKPLKPLAACPFLEARRHSLCSFLERAPILPRDGSLPDLPMSSHTKFGIVPADERSSATIVDACSSATIVSL